MGINKINFNDKFDKISRFWSPKIIGELNDYQFKLAKFKDDFIRHNHPDTDEAFIVIEGEIYIDFDDKTETTKAGEMIVVPKGVYHKPYSKKEAKVLMIEPRGTVNTGDIINELTLSNDNWIQLLIYCNFFTF